MKIATAYVEVRTDKSKLDRDLGDVEKSVKEKATSTAKVFAQIFGAAAFGAVVKGSIDAASDLNETVSKTKTLFGQDADAVIAFSKTTAQSMGLSQRAYLDAAAGLKGLLDNLGLAPAQATEWSQKLTQLGSDLGSFFNKDPAEAVEAIGSAMRGESEPIRAFNVQINDAAIKQKALELGLYSGKGAIEQNAKAQATLALIMEQTTAAQGDFAKTADGAANSQRIAKATAEDSAASLGQAFLPIYTKVVQVVTAVAKAFGTLPAPVQVAVVALAGLVALSGPIGVVVDMAKNLTNQIKNLSATTQSAALGLGVFAGVTMVGLALHAKAAADRANDVSEAIQGISRATSDQAAITEFWRFFTTNVLTGDDAMKKLTETNLEGAKRILELGDATGLTAEGQEALRVAIVNEDAARAAAVKTTEDHTAALGEEATAVGKVMTAEEGAALATELIKAATEEATRKSDVFAESLQRQLDKLDQLYPKEYNAVTAKYDYADAQAAAMVAVDNLNKTLGDHKATQEDVNAATNAARDAILDQSLKYAVLDGAAVGSEGAIRRQIKSLQDQAASLDPSSPLRQFLDQYISDLENIPANVSTTLLLHVSADATNAGAPGYVPRFGTGGRGATGQPTRRGALTEVAEQDRPEVYEQNGKMYLLPTASGKVSPWGSSVPSGSGGGLPPINVYNNGREFTVDDMSRAIQLARLS